MSYFFSGITTASVEMKSEPASTFSTPIDFIRSIERSNKALVAWQKKSPGERSQFLTNCIAAFSALSNAWQAALIADYDLSLDAAKAAYEEALALLIELQSQASEKISSVGSSYQHVFILQDEDRPISFFILLVLGALLQGNAVYTHKIRSLPNLSSCLKLWWTQAQLPDGLFHCFDFFDDSSENDFIDLMINHPAIKACFLMGQWEVLTRRYSQVLGEKKVFILGEARDVAIVLDLSTVDANFFAPMASSYSYRTRPSRVFVLDSCFDQFVLRFEDFLSKHPLKKFKALNSARTEYEMLKKEEGRVISDNLGNCALVKVDFPNCSTYQQQRLFGSSVTVTRSKYAHEAMRFANTTILGFSGSIWGDDIRAHKFALDLEVCFVSVNKHFRPSFDLKLQDLKNSTLGTSGKSFWNLFLIIPQVL